MKVLFNHFLGGNKKKHRTDLRIAIVLAEARSEHISNTNQGHCRYINPFGAFRLILRINMLIVIIFDHVTGTQCVCVREEGEGSPSICTDTNKLDNYQSCLTFRRPRLRRSVPPQTTLADVFEVFTDLLKYGTTTGFQFYHL
jgi:hypothetical protein